MLQKLYQGDAAQAFDSIKQTVATNGFARISFLYFANAMKRHLFESPEGDTDFLVSRDAYIKALSSADYLFPDGIALQTFSRLIAKRQIDNLNGTDFIDYFLQRVKTTDSVSIYLYQCYDPSHGKSKQSLEQAVQALEKEYDLPVKWADQCLYTQRSLEFDSTVLEKVLQDDTSTYKIFLNCTGTPFQEKRGQVHTPLFKKYGVTCFDAGGFIDFVTGFETRAPKWVVKARVLETFWRVFTKPGKNFHKFASMFGVVRFLWKPVVSEIKT